MKTESYIRIMAGTMVLISVALTHFVSPWWLLMTCFVGFNLIQSAFTGFCPAEMILAKLGLGDGACCCGDKSGKQECCSGDTSDKQPCCSGDKSGK
jgi:hypothetical protein